jgi:hypothetical protein
MSDNTAVSEKDLPAIPMPTYVNAPETLEDAVQRILQVEMLLEDMSRAAEIAAITGQFNIIEGFRTSAEEYLKGKIQIEQPDMGEFKLTVVSGKVSEETAKQLSDKLNDAKA